MKTPTLDQQFLSYLSPEQKGQVWNYYLLITNQNMNPDQQIAQISQIWSCAEKDERLMEWLEFIDYFYTDVDEGDLPSSAQRTYLSEYLTEKVGLPPKDSSFYAPVFLRCPEGKGYVAVSRNFGEPHDSASLPQQRCNNCGYNLSQHTDVTDGVSLPEA
ncbi:hypothetical protein IQ265_20060 [Nodosilinea sp. LEGE 06152]|uniref:hypothetical protein n=1 Tax=Nodosilinea sp. LEGE 06152 TaxID=2777966 RepID=UPI001881E1EA|nr:hypothetical protein [Nodosilinea sp. LEGE 06152]MBE9159112.1 hypothetical protein [Nodosilinea sp. LEGE 06152]